MLASLVLELLTMLFWFAGFVALAVFHRDLVNEIDFFFSGGCGALGNTCGVIEAAVVFGALEWYVKPPCPMWDLPRKATVGSVRGEPRTCRKSCPVCRHR